MRDILKRLARMVIGYGAVTWAGPLLSLVFTPILLHVLSVGEYGVADYWLSIINALSVLGLFGLNQAVTAHYRDQADEGWSRQVVGAAILLALVSTTAIGLVFAFWTRPIAAALGIREPAAGLLAWIGLPLALGACGSLFSTAAQSALRVRWGMVFSLATILATVGGYTLFILVLRLGPLGLALTPILAGVVCFVVGLVLARSLVGRPSWEVVRLVVRSGALLLPVVAAGWVLQVADRSFLVRYASEAELGYYAVANRFAGLLGVAVTPLFAAWTPLALAMQREEDAQHRYTIVARLMVGTAMIGSLALGLFALEILIVVGRPMYFPAAGFVGLLTLPYVMQAMTLTLQVNQYITKRLAGLGVAVVAGAVFNLVLNALLIPPWHVWGATLATLLGYGLTMAIIYADLKPRLPVPYPMATFALALVVELALLALGAVLPAWWWPLRIVAKLGLVALLGVSFVAVGIVRPVELRLAWQSLRFRAQRITSRLQPLS